MQPDNTQKKVADGDGLTVIGIGASAGGLEALETMFAEMPTHGGMAFVIVQHLSPDFKSLMVELLERHTKMAIHRVQHSMEVQPDSLYLIPPKQDMIIKDGRLLLTERESTRSPSLPIDLFMTSLAQDKGNKSVGIILSGTGSDGSRGIKHIHDAGGLVIVQSPESAKFDGMPKSAIASGVASVVTTPEKISGLLQEYATHGNREALQLEIVPDSESAMERAFRILLKKHRVDFSHYRLSTIMRRIERRIEMNLAIDDFHSYVDLLENDPIELDQLFSDLLIGVTSFFRDPERFESLKKDTLVKLLEEHPADEEFRVWVTACATGEEAYSVAMLIDECLRESSKRIDAKVFATDINQASIKKATAGIYSVDSLQGVSENRLARYFVPSEGGYQIVPDIRRMVVFAPHNLIKDPPFTRLSLVTCRNFLIYLTPPAQNKVLAHFHFALKRNGVLMLGPSESTGELASEFESIAAGANARIFMKTRDTRLSNTILTNGLIQTSPSIKPYFPVRMPLEVSRSGNDLSLSNEELLANFVPPGILVDTNGQVLQVFCNAGKYLQVSDGVLSSSLMDMVNEELRMAIGGAMQRCTKRNEPVRYDRLQVETVDGEVIDVQLTVTPLPRKKVPTKFVITFEQLHRESPDVDSSRSVSLQLDEVSKRHLEELEQKLRHNREILQATTEEMETSNEELQATNEELIASNEELQSANEELHSVNEELFTVNGEYQRKIAELTELTHDFDNLLESTEVHTLFLDKLLCIRKFTPKMAEVLHLVSQDIGRRIVAFVHNINCEDLNGKIQQVLATGKPWQEQIVDSNHAEFLLRVLPYWAGAEIQGVVLTLVDISRLAEAQKAVTLERERFERAIRANRDGTWDWPDLTKPEMWWSPTCYEILGYQPNAFPSLHSEWMRLIHPEDRERIEKSSLPASHKCYVELHENFEYRMLHRSGEYRWYCHRAIVDVDDNGKAIRMTGSIADIHDRKASEDFAREGIRSRDNFLSMLSHELRNPVGAVMNAMMNLDSIASEQPDFEGHAELDVIRRQTRQMSRLMDDLLDVARFGRDKIEFRKEIVDLCELVDAVIESVDYRLAEKKQILKTSICEGPMNVIGDPSRITQAQTNLIVNASKFSEPGQEVSYKIERDDDQAVISVSDKGSGIAAEILDSVFDLFVQSDKTLDRSDGGMGVGLSLTHKIVKAHNGTVTAASDGPGKGSMFQIRLPLTALAHENRRDNRISIPDSPLTCKVMLVEDNADALAMMAKTFRRKGFEVREVTDGKAAILEFPEFEPAVAVVDIGLPKISGYDVARAIRQNPLWDNVGLVALTGYGQQSEKAAMLDAGFDHVMVKPLIFEELHQLILRFLNK